uniref:Uncharacterized protein n=1 Tax=Timema douglasi TaxID=61478 RepID=A0A7R8VX80_TIMDO|nr:unnamed protein product [Timema douglasi]
MVDRSERISARGSHYMLPRSSVNLSRDRYQLNIFRYPPHQTIPGMLSKQVVYLLAIIFIGLFSYPPLLLTLSIHFKTLLIPLYPLSSSALIYVLYWNAGLPVIVSVSSPKVYVHVPVVQQGPGETRRRGSDNSSYSDHSHFPECEESGEGLTGKYLLNEYFPSHVCLGVYVCQQPYGILYTIECSVCECAQVGWSRERLGETRRDKESMLAVTGSEVIPEIVGIQQVCE